MKPLCLSLLCVAIWSCGEETSGQCYGGVLQLFDTGTVNWFRAIPTHPTHTNKGFHFITLLICTTVMSGSCSLHHHKTPKLLSREVVSIFSLSFFSLWPLTLTVLKHKELYLCSVVLLPKSLQLWGKVSFQKDVSMLWCAALHSLSDSGEHDHVTDPCSQPWGFSGFLSLPLDDHPDFALTQGAV